MLIFETIKANQVRLAFSMEANVEVGLKVFDISIRKLIQMDLNYEPSVPCASIIWLARAVKVERPFALRLHR